MKDSLFEHDTSFDRLRGAYQTGKIPKLNKSEMAFLKKCHAIEESVGMRNFIINELTEHPITFNEDGSLKYSWYNDPNNRKNIISEEETRRQAEIERCQEEINKRIIEIEALKKEMDNHI